MTYIPKGSNIALKIIDKEMKKSTPSKFLVYYDPDIDGLMAGFISQRFISKFGRTSVYHINENREHGFKMPEEIRKNLKGMTVIAVDFSMSREDVKNLLALGANVVSIDHHEIDDTFIHEKNEETGCEGVVINNQYAWEPEEYKFLSGAGVVYYVLRYMLDELRYADDLRDEKALVGVSLLSDIRPIENPIAQEFLKETYTNNSKLLKYLVDVVTKVDGFERFDSFGVPCMNRNFVDYTFSPYFNALFRTNNGEEAIKLMHGNKESVNRYKYHGIFEVTKKLQNTIAAEIMSALQGEELSHLIVKGVSNTFKLNSQHRMSNFIGLACSKVKGDNKTTFLFVESETAGVIQRGSVRGLYDNVDYLKIFRDAGIQAAGHKNAFGVLPTDVTKVDIYALNDAIAKAEIEAVKNGIDNRRIVDTTNLTLFLKGPNKKIAWYNTMVRDSYRVYLKYKGDNIQKNQRGKMIEYIIDGVPVKCFDLDLTVEEGLILPIYGKGDYIEFTLRREPKKIS